LESPLVSLAAAGSEEVLILFSYFGCAAGHRGKSSGKEAERERTQRSGNSSNPDIGGPGS
jgi:hypothetical protein